MIIGNICPHMWTDLSFAIYELDIGPNMRLNIPTFLIVVSVGSFAGGGRMTQKYPDSFRCTISCAHTPTDTEGQLQLCGCPGVPRSEPGMLSSWSPRAVRGSNKSKLHELCCWSMDAVAVAPGLWEEGSQPEHSVGGVGAFSVSKTRVTDLQGKYETS